MTNGDKIRAMTDEELAIALQEIIEADVCLNPKCFDCDSCCFTSFCDTRDAASWVKQEEEE